MRIQDVRYVGKTFYDIVSQLVNPVTEARRADPLPSPSWGSEASAFEGMKQGRFPD